MVGVDKHFIEDENSAFSKWRRRKVFTFISLGSEKRRFLLLDRSFSFRWRMERMSYNVKISFLLLEFFEL